jgi:PAS domain S-box-containing protein
MLHFERVAECRATPILRSTALCDNIPVLGASTFPRAATVDARFDSVGERRLAETLEDAPVAIQWVGADGRILWANRTELRLLGYAPEEYIGRSILDFHVDRDLAETMLLRLSRGEALTAVEARMRASDGTIRHVVVDSNALWQDGRFVHTRCFTRDVTGQAHLTNALRFSEDRFRTLCEEAPVGLFLTDASGRCKFVNERWTEISGLEAADALGRGWTRAIHPADRDRIFAEWTEATANGREFASEYRFQKPHGETRWVEGRAVPFRNDGHQVVEFLGTITDVTGRKQLDAARELALQSAERYAKRIQRLQAVTAELARRTDPERVAEVAVDHGIAAVEAKTGAIYLRNDDGVHATMIRALGYRADELTRFTQIPIMTTTPLGDALRSESPVYLETRAEYASRYPESEKRTREVTDADVAIACLPLLADGRTIGVLTLAFADGRRFEPEERSFLELLAYHCAQAFERTGLIEQERRARQSAEAAAARLKLLADASRAFSAARLEIAPVLAALAESVIGNIGDSCTVFFVDEIEGC